MSLSDGLLTLPGGLMLGPSQERIAQAREQAKMDQQRQVQSASVRSFLNTQGQVGTPGTMGFEVNGRQYGQDTQATPLVSRETQLGNLQRAAPEAFNAAAIQSALAQAFPQAQAPVSIAEGGMLVDPRTGRQIASNPKPQTLPSDVQSALFAANGNAELAREILTSRGVDGEWALNKSTGVPQFISRQALLSDNGRNFTKPPSGMNIQSDGKGGFSITTGDGGAGGFGKPAQNMLEENYIKAGEGFARLKGIESSFKPEYQQLGTRWSALGSSFKDKAGIAIPEADRAQLADYSAYRADAIDNISQYIKDITGAAAAAQEMERITKGMPNPGQGLFDGDSPTEFRSKLNSTMKRLASVQARMAYAKANGMDQKQMFAVPLDSIPQIINTKGNELREQLRSENPNAPQSQINEMVKARLRQEFGLQ